MILNKFIDLSYLAVYYVFLIDAEFYAFTRKVASVWTRKFVVLAVLNQSLGIPKRGMTILAKYP